MSAKGATSRRGFLGNALAALGALGVTAGLGRVAPAVAAAGGSGNETQGDQAFVGEIRLFAGSSPPDGWMFCEGQLLPIAENETLFVLVGTTYGGDGQFTFGLPDLRGRVPVHRGTGSFGSTYDQGEMAGVNEVTLVANQIPAHTHALAASSMPGDSDSPAGRVPALDAAGTPRYAAAADGNLAAAAIESAGGGQPHENRQPFVALHFMISLYGVFPAAN